MTASRAVNGALLAAGALTLMFTARPTPALLAAIAVLVGGASVQVWRESRAARPETGGAA